MGGLRRERRNRVRAHIVAERRHAVRKAKQEAIDAYHRKRAVATLRRMGLVKEAEDYLGEVDDLIDRVDELKADSLPTAPCQDEDEPEG